MDMTSVNTREGEPRPFQPTTAKRAILKLTAHPVATLITALI